MGNVASSECDHGFKSSVTKTVFLRSLRCEGLILITTASQIKRKIFRAIQREAKQLGLETENPEQLGCSGEV